MLPTVLVTGVAGWFFGWLAERSGSLAAPMLAHLAINEAGAVAALVVAAFPTTSFIVAPTSGVHGVVTQLAAHT